MLPTTSSIAVGVFQTREQADKAVDALFNAGFTTNEIGVVTRDGNVTSKSSKVAKNEAEDAGTGAATGAALGAGVGGLIGLGVLAGFIPVVGPALFAGTLGVLASNAAGGAAVVGVIGALTGWGVPEEHARHYESEVAAGRAVVTVNSEARIDEARAIMIRHGATSKDPAFSAAASN